MTRKTATTDTRRRLVHFYDGKRCVLRLELGTSVSPIQWAHLEDGNATRVPTFSDLVPLSQGYNTTQEEWRRKSPSNEVDQAEELCSDFVARKANAAFHRCRPASAYGASRLGLALSMQYEILFRALPGDAWAFANECLVYLPYCMQTELLTSLLLTLERLAETESSIPSVHKASILLSLSNLYQDQGEWRASRELHSKIGEIEPTRANTMASVARREALAILLTSGERDRIEYLFDKSIGLYDILDFELGVRIAKAWNFTAAGNLRAALKELEPFDVKRYENLYDAIKFLSPHNVYELNLIRASIKKGLDISYEREMEIILTLQKKHPETQLRRVFTKHIAPVVVDPTFSKLYQTLSADFTPSIKLMELLARVTRKIISKDESTILASRWSFAD